MTQAIRAENLSKTFRLPVPAEGGGLLARLRHFIRNPTRPLEAVRELSFQVERGEVLGFLGANGSGKSTTIKMLTGILTPTSGDLQVLGYVPHRQRHAYTHHIGLVLGQKSLLWWNIPVLESFKLYRDIYGVPDREFEERLDRFSKVLEIRDYLHVPVRKLSLGLRMRAEIVASLLHNPEIIFLDEPTIGLDVLARLNLKRFLRRINEDLGTTLLLTTHNMFDVEDLCRRCVILERGQLIFDGEVEELKSHERHKRVELEVMEVRDPDRFAAALERCRVLERSETRFLLQVVADEVVDVIDELFAASRLANLNVVPPTLESVVERLFRGDREQEDGDAAKVLSVAV